MKQQNRVPQDWQVIKLNNLFETIPNLSNAREDLTDIAQKVMYIHYGDIHTNSIHEKINLQEDTLPYLLDNKIEKDINDMLLKNGDVIITDASEDYEGIAKSVEITNINNKKVVAGLHTIVLRPIKNIVSIGYGSYLLQMPITSKKLKSISQGTKVISISFQLIKDLDLFLPSIKEQEKIVEILELWDKAIETTKKLIEQKKLQKKYLMQKLLTGKIRLKGFKDKWIKTNLGKISIMQSGGTPSTKKQEYFDGNILWASVSDMSSSKKYIDSTEKTISEKGLKNSNAKLFPKGTILFAMYASIGEVCITKVPMTTSQAILSICCSDQLYNEYLYYCLLLYKKIFISLGQTGTQSNLNKGMVENIVLHLPKYNEQKAIANILSTADNQITLLEQKLSKLELQKKGLMQKLLTGQIRV